MIFRSDNYRNETETTLLLTERSGAVSKKYKPGINDELRLRTTSTVKHL